MTLPHDEIQEALIEQWNALATLLDSLSDEQWSQPSNLPGWTVQDIASHVIGTESFLLGETPPESPSERGEHIRNPVGEFNERWVSALRTRSPQEMRTIFRDVITRREAALRGMTADQWQAETPSPVGQTTYARFMRVRVFDCWMHEIDIRDALTLPGPSTGHRAQVAFREIPGSLGFAIGKRGKAPEGSRIAIHLTGGLEQTINVEVAGRAAVVESLSGPATTSLTLDSLLFVRLCGGRVDPAAQLDAVQIDGDVEVGRRIAENLAFTI
ncbi:maleylpyruvate isomerase family mycothiol-dependent enzyme [Smaragdicoccus niigatensis]|uniref:maleylpyruvate isomerase family mycothiol-dependent enzyme n=1 Tax=Smaragdicoccus niigatensis TaxID=359359 RepID=UPI0003749B74|nr:maleylpyruvate isomerase family mycothiol-dependent enzyme [Smaragdicoccus niigatensis]